MTSPALAVTVGTGRGYSHPISGEVVPSVTTVLNVLDKPALPRWAAKVVAEFAAANKSSWINLPDDAAIDMLKGSPWRTRDKAAAAGTDAHEYCEGLLRGEIDINSPFDPPGLGEAARNLRSILKTIKPQPLSIEGTVWSHTNGYAGSFDGIHIIDGEVTLVDLKTSTGVYPDYSIQLAAYKYADVILRLDGSEVPIPPITRCQIWHAPKEGNASVVDMDVTEAEFGVFKAALEVFKWKADRSKSVMGKKQKI
jgi:hypothetical protein